MTKKNERRFYVYAYLRSKDSEHGKKLTPYYIGKGSNNRAFCRHQRACPAPQKDEHIVFVQEGLTEDEAFNLERYCIGLYGRIDQNTGILRNLTDGGDGPSGYKHTLATRLCLSEKLKGRASWWKGKTHSKESRVKMSKSAQGRKQSREAIEKKRKALLGLKRSEETRRKIAEIRTGTTHSEETKQKISRNRKGKTAGEQNPQWGRRGELSPNYGKPRSEETRRKISEAHKGKKMPKQSAMSIGKQLASRAKYLYELIDPQGEVYMTESLQDFAKQYGLTSSCLYRAVNGQLKHHRGWTVRIAETLR
jgi:hypothetical protein